MPNDTRGTGIVRRKTHKNLMILEKGAGEMCLWGERSAAFASVRMKTSFVGDGTDKGRLMRFHYVHDFSSLCKRATIMKGKHI